MGNSRAGAMSRAARQEVKQMSANAKFAPRPMRRATAALAVATSVAVLIASAGAAGAAERIVFGLNWMPQAEMCGFFQARETGLYSAAGLDVELVPGGPGMNMAQLVAAGKYDLSMGSALTTLAMRKEAIPGVTVAAMLQKSPSTFVAHPGQGISKLEDLRGRPVAVSNFGRAYQWAWAKAKFGYDDSQLRPYVYNPAAFVANPELSQQGYITEDAYFLGKALGAKPVSMLLADRGYPDYATTVFGMDSTMKTRHAAVARFVAASARGFAECVSGDPSKAIAAIAAAAPEQTPELSKFKLAQMKRYDMVTGGDAKQLGVGAMTDARWATVFKTMSDLGIYPKDLDYKSAYSLEFTNKGPGVGN
jgi:NitT/TauT family transport system substrate-binding protein